MKNTYAYLRIALVTILAYFVLDWVVDTGTEYTYAEHPILWGVVVFVFLFAMAIEYSVEALNSILYRAMDEEKRAKYDAATAEAKANQFAGLKRIYKKLLGSRPIEEEGEIILDHNYDGRKELDNKLPPWWLYGFYVTIIFGVIYMAKYHIFQGADQATEFEIQMEEARIAVEAYKAQAKDLVDASTVVMLTDAADLSAGKNRFEKNCAVCHKPDGGGLTGPNLTDEYWILGGGISNVFTTISKGGRPGKGMVNWNRTFTPNEIAQLASYVLSMQGSNPPDALPADGELWVDPNAGSEAVESELEASEVINDSTATAGISMN